MGGVAEMMPTSTVMLTASVGTSMKSSRQAPGWMVAMMPSPVRSGWRSRKIPRLMLVPTMIRGIIHHGEQPLADAILAGEVAQSARPIGVLHAD